MYLVERVWQNNIVVSILLKQYLTYKFNITFCCQNEAPWILKWLQSLSITCGLAVKQFMVGSLHRKVRENDVKCTKRAGSLLMCIVCGKPLKPYSDMDYIYNS